MTAPSKMTTPKEALEQAYNELNTIRARDGVPYNYGEFPSDVDRDYFSKVVDDCKAAIPVAELHQEAVEFLADRHSDSSCYCNVYDNVMSGVCNWCKEDALFTKLEALK